MSNLGRLKKYFEAKIKNKKSAKKKLSVHFGFRYTGIREKIRSWHNIPFFCFNIFFIKSFLDECLVLSWDLYIFCNLLSIKAFNQVKLLNIELSNFSRVEPFYGNSPLLGKVSKSKIWNFFNSFFPFFSKAQKVKYLRHL